MTIEREYINKFIFESAQKDEEVPSWFKYERGRKVKFVDDKQHPIVGVIHTSIADKHGHLKLRIVDANGKAYWRDSLDVQLESAQTNEDWNVGAIVYSADGQDKLKVTKVLPDNKYEVTSENGDKTIMSKEDLSSYSQGTLKAEYKKRQTLSDEDYTEFIKKYMTNNQSFDELLNMLPMINDDLRDHYEYKTIKPYQLKKFYKMATKEKTESKEENSIYSVVKELDQDPRVVSTGITKDNKQDLSVSLKTGSSAKDKQEIEVKTKELLNKYNKTNKFSVGICSESMESEFEVARAKYKAADIFKQLGRIFTALAGGDIDVLNMDPRNMDAIIDCIQQLKIAMTAHDQALIDAVEKAQYELDRNRDRD